jgi:hypothetical protein
MFEEFLPDDVVVSEKGCLHQRTPFAAIFDLGVAGW